jgi:hypothetical protein
MLSGEIAVQIFDENGALITTDVGIGTPFGEVHLTDISKLEEVGFSRDEILDLPYLEKSYDYLPEFDESEMESSLTKLWKIRDSLN